MYNYFRFQFISNRIIQIIYLKNTKKEGQMQLQQSGFLLSRLMLSPTPKSLLIVISFILLTIILANSFLMSLSRPNLSMGQCLSKYYKATHQNISQYLESQADKLNQNKTAIQLAQLIKYLHYLNSSRLLHFESSKLLPEGSPCTIQLNYNTAQSEQSEENGILIPIYNTLGYMVSNYPLFHLNFTDRELLRKHGIAIDRIIIPPINTGFRYFGMDVSVNIEEDFLYVLQKQFKQFQADAKSLWVQQVDNIITQLEKANQELKNNKNAKIEQNTSSSKLSQSQNINKINQNVNSSSPVVAEQSNQTSEANTTKQHTKEQQLQKIAKKLSIIQNLMALGEQKSMGSSHRVMFKFDSVNKWHSLHLPQSPQHSSSFILQVLEKFLTSYLILCLLICTFWFIAICIRYSYIIVATLLVLLFGNKFKKYAGWLHRYSDLYLTSQPDSKMNHVKIRLQIIFSFLAFYILFAVMGKYLAENMSMVFISFQIMPNHPVAIDQLYKTFFIVQLIHYFFLRTRTTLAYFGKFSMLSTVVFLMIISYNPFFMTSAFVNLHFFINLLLIALFLFIEKLICQESLHSQYKPSLDKPRMLFYLGFDLDWHKGIPPVWTMFQTWFDLGYANQQQRSYIERNYQLLYGKLLGVNQPQQLPQQDEDSQQISNFKQVDMSENSE